MKTSENQERIPVKYEVMMTIVIPLIILPVFFLTLFAAPLLGINLEKMSFFRAYVSVLAIILPLIIVPAAMFSGSIAFPVLGAALSNMYDPLDLISAIITTITISFVAFSIEYLIFHLFPDPVNSWFEPMFIVASFAFAAVCYDLLFTWKG